MGRFFKSMILSLALAGGCGPNNGILLDPPEAAEDVQLEAAECLHSCPDNAVCLYKDSDFQVCARPFFDAGWQNLSRYGLSDSVSSWKNRKGNTAYLSWDVNGCGRILPLDSHNSDPHMGSWNDKASAICARPPCRPC